MGRPGSPFPPDPPRLKTATTSSLEIEWTLPELPGIAQICEVQFYVDKAASANTMRQRQSSSQSTPEPPSSPPKWMVCVSRRWEYEDFNRWQHRDLSPGLALLFRLRYRNLDAWSVWSEASTHFRTLPAAPAKPSPPLLTKVFPDSVQLVINFSSLSILPTYPHSLSLFLSLSLSNTHTHKLVDYLYFSLPPIGLAES